MLIEPADGESWGPQDINKMTMEEYTKYRAHIFNQIGLMTPDEVRSAETTIPKPLPPRPKWHFESF